MNLIPLAPSRKRLSAGDVFAMKPKAEAEGFIFGRVIRTDAVGLAPGAILIYIYLYRSDKKEVPTDDQMSPERLMVPPMMTNRLPWSRGYFETIDNVPLQADDLLEHHVYRHTMSRRLYDELQNEVSEDVEPTMLPGLQSYRTIDDEISRALGLPMAED